MHKIVQVGIRSMDISETNTVNNDKVFFAHDMLTNQYWMDNAIEKLTENVVM